MADEPNSSILGRLFSVPPGEMRVRMTIRHESQALHFLGFVFESWQICTLDTPRSIWRFVRF